MYILFSLQDITPIDFQSALGDLPFCYGSHLLLSFLPGPAVQLCAG
jgi:hypothetical protein